MNIVLLQKLKDMKPTYSNMSYKAAMSKENAAKNAVQNILPGKSQDINSLSDDTDHYFYLEFSVMQQYAVF